MADRLTAGNENAWEGQNGPVWTRHGDVCRVTFYWRDPQGCAQTSPIKRVWIYITGVTDHHASAVPQSLARQPGTDLWSWQITLPASWRGSYCFIPSVNENDFSPSLFSGGEPDRALLREGWRTLLPQAIADPLNPHGWRGGRGHPVSALALPDAPEQPGWQNAPECAAQPTCLTWRSELLGNTRRVWVFATAESSPAQRPLAILLDGQFWAQSMPVWPALTTLTRQGQLPAAVYLLIDVIDTEHRRQELPCNPDFWIAIQQELLPQIQAHTPFSDRADRTVVAGQSFGGLSAMYAALRWPQRFGCVLSQSGSYWWPQRAAAQQGQLLGQLSRGELTPRHLRVWLEAGEREPLIFGVNQILKQQLQQARQTVFWRPVDGGHDAFCWRGGLTAGLIQLWQPLTDSHV